MIMTGQPGLVVVQAPAKVNLFLELHGRRDDGYHEIETVMQAISLYDRIELRPQAQTGIVLECTDPSLPTDDGNIAWRAASLLERKIGLPQGLSIRLEKCIPHGAGLGGGSSDAAAVLAGINRLFAMGLDKEFLAESGAELGSDVPFFTHGGAALCEGRGEKITPVPSELDAFFVVCCPDYVQPTAAVYQNAANWGLTSGDGNSSLILDSLAHGDYSSTRARLFNRLEAAAIRLAPVVGQVKARLEAAAGCRALVSGSGSSVYVMVESLERAQRVAASLKAEPDERVFVARAETGSE